MSLPLGPLSMNESMSESLKSMSDTVTDSFTFSFTVSLCDSVSVSFVSFIAHHLVHLSELAVSVDVPSPWKTT